MCTELNSATILGTIVVLPTLDAKQLAARAVMKGQRNMVWELIQHSSYPLYPLQFSCLESPMDRGAWWAAVHGVAKSQTRLRDFTFMHRRRKWQLTPVFLPGESQGWRSLVGCRLRDHAESDTTEAT